MITFAFWVNFSFKILISKAASSSWSSPGSVFCVLCPFLGASFLMSFRVDWSMCDRLAACPSCLTPLLLQSNACWDMLQCSLDNEEKKKKEEKNKAGKEYKWGGGWAQTEGTQLVHWEQQRTCYFIKCMTSHPPPGRLREAVQLGKTVPPLWESHLTSQG